MLDECDTWFAMMRTQNTLRCLYVKIKMQKDKEIKY